MILKIDDSHYVNMNKVSSIEIKKVMDEDEFYVNIQFDSVRNELRIEQDEAERIATELSNIAKRETEVIYPNNFPRRFVRPVSVDTSKDGAEHIKFTAVNPEQMESYCMKHGKFKDHGVCPECLDSVNTYCPEHGYLIENGICPNCEHIRDECKREEKKDGE